MKITFDCPDKINGLLTMTIESADYQEQVEKTRRIIVRRLRFLASVREWFPWE